MTEGFIEEKEDGACYVGQPEPVRYAELNEKIKILKNKLLQVKPELKEWIKINFGE